MFLTFFLVFLLISILFDWWTIQCGIQITKKGHLVRWYIRAITAAIFMYFDHNWPLYILIPTYSISFWFLFDTTLNILRGKNLWYLGSNWLDKLQKKYPNEFVWFWFKGIAFIGLIGAYYF